MKAKYKALPKWLRFILEGAFAIVTTPILLPLFVLLYICIMPIDWLIQQYKDFK